MRVCMGGERAYVYHQYKCGRRMKGNKNENDTINYKQNFLQTWTLVILKISDKVHLFWIHFAYPQNTATSRSCCCCLVVRSYPTLCNPMNRSLPGSTAHGISQARIMGVGCHALLQGTFPTWGSNLSLLHFLYYRATGEAHL